MTLERNNMENFIHNLNSSSRLDITIIKRDGKVGIEIRNVEADGYDTPVSKLLGDGFSIWINPDGSHSSYNLSPGG